MGRSLIPSGTPLGYGAPYHEVHLGKLLMNFSKPHSTISGISCPPLEGSTTVLLKQDELAIQGVPSQEKVGLSIMKHEPHMS